MIPTAMAKYPARTSERVSIVVVNFNSGGLLERCLSAVDRQTLRPQQVIVVDNDSTDGSATGLETRHSGVRVIHLRENLGFAAANNLGIKSCNSDWIALLNPDAFPEPDWLAALLRATRSYPKYSFWGSHMINAADPNLMDGTGDTYHVSGFAWRRDEDKSTTQCSNEPHEIFSPCAAAALYRRDCFLEVGGFDERYFCYLEDVDLAFRLRLTGYRCLCVPDAVVYHVGSAITGRHSDFAIYHGHRNLVWTFIKNMPGGMFWLYLPQHLLLNLVSLVWFSCRGKAGIIFKSKADALKGLPQAWKERRAIQAGRKIGAWQLTRVMSKGLLKPYWRSLKQTHRLATAKNRPAPTP